MSGSPIPQTVINPFTSDSGGGSPFINWSLLPVLPVYAGDSIAAALATLESTGGTLVLTAATYDITAELQISAASKTIRIVGQPHAGYSGGGTRIRATAAMRSVMAVLGPYHTFEHIVLDANDLATYGRYLDQWAFGRSIGCRFTGAIKDGTYASDSGINDTAISISDWYDHNGSVWASAGIIGQYPSGGFAKNPIAITGTASITAGNATINIVGSATDLTTIGLRKGDPIRVGATAATAYYGLINTVAAASVTIQNGGFSAPLPTVTAVGQEFAIGSGDAWHDERQANNQLTTFLNCLLRGSGGSGLRSNGLFGHTTIGGQFDFNSFFGISIASTDGTICWSGSYTHPYCEANISTHAFYIGAGRNITITNPVLNGETWLVAGTLPDTGTVYMNGLAEDLILGAFQNFLLEFWNDAGTIKHRTVGEFANAYNPLHATKILNRSAAWTATPLVAAGVGFATGVGISAAATHAVLFDVARDQDEAMQGLATIESNESGTAICVALGITNSNVNGTTRSRPRILLTDAATGVPFNLTALGVGKTIRIRVHVRIRG